MRCDFLLFEEVAVDFELLLEHDFPPIFNDEGVGLQVLGCPEDLSVFLHPRHPSQLELCGAADIQRFVLSYDFINVKKSNLERPAEFTTILSAVLFFIDYMHFTPAV